MRSLWAVAVIAFGAPALADPKAALFSFSMALVAYNILATLRGALGSVHGVSKIEVGLSDFYLVDEIQGTYRGMMIAIPLDTYQITHPGG